MVRCKNCGTVFATRYRYTRHKCEFNAADKVVLVADSGMSGKQFGKKNDLERPQTSHHSTQENVCEHCNIQFSNANMLQIHKKKYCTKVSKFYHSKNFIAATSGRDNNKSKQDESQDLENQAPTQKKRGRKQKHHKRVVKAKPLSITAEEGWFDDITELETHRKKEHASVVPFEECGQVVRRARALFIHGPAHQSLKLYLCEQCGQSFLQESELLQHLHFHQGIKPFVCPHKNCEARYTIHSKLEDHISNAHPHEQFSSYVCSTGLMTGPNYYRHWLIHTNDPTYRCNICKKRFFHADDQTLHRRIYTDERPYQVCGQLLQSIGNRHRQIHTDEWPYSCKVCGKKYQNYVNMNRHHRTHTNKRPLRCEICTKKFQSRGDRNRHRRIHTDE